MDLPAPAPERGYVRPPSNTGVDQPHTRQFLVGPKPNAVKEDWKLLKLDDELWLSYCPKLAVRSAVNVEGKRVTLIGVPIECRAERPRPEIALEGLKVDTFREITYSWSSRWCIIVGQEIITDAGSLMAVFYPEPSTHKEREFYVSSSQKLLSRFYDLSWDDSNTPYAPATYSPQLLCLLPDQRLDLKYGTVENPTYPYLDLIQETEAHLREQVASLLTVFMREVYRIEQQPVHISLSGGADSRRNLAAALAAKIPTRPFTMRKAYWKMSDADLSMPKRVCQEAGLDLLTIDARNRSPIRAKEQTYEEQTAFRKSMYPGETYFYHVTGCWDELPSEACFIDGQAYELVGNYYYREKAPFATIEEMLGWGFRAPPDTRGETLRYAEQVRHNGGSFFDLRDFAFLLANMPVYGHMYQFLDMRFHVYCPVNCRMTYSLSQSVGEARRQDKKFFLSVTDLLEPRFQRVPTNPPDNIVKRTLPRIRSKARRFRSKYLSRTQKG